MSSQIPSFFSNDIVLHVEGIRKVYPNGVIANDNVTLSVFKGEIHAILGENGAGKTTLVNIIAGCIKPDAGEIYVNGKKVNIDNPRTATKLGIGVVHQHFILIPALTVIENIALSLDSGFKLDLNKVREKILQISSLLNLKIDLNARIEELPVGLRQRVEILRVLCQNANILILDEPTSVLTPIEVEEFFRILRNLKEKDCSIILITHKVKEALSISDRITIMRKGKVIKTLTPKETNEEELTLLIIGEKQNSEFISLTEGNNKNKEILLLVNNLNVKGDRGELSVKNVSFSLYSGEILGIAGVAGNGQKELIEALTGLRKPESGTIIIRGENVINKKPKLLIKKGMAYIPEDRIGRGVILTMSIAENAILKIFEENPFSDKTIMNRNSITDYTQKLIKKFGIIAPNPNIEVRALSGGNIQRLIIARELSYNAKILIAENPTAGLDVRATDFTHRMLLDLRSKGMGILLVSADLDELLKLSDRILVMYNGKIMKEFNRNEYDIYKIARLMLGIEV
ncbi:MAG: ABC transporter ATP-binding protein [Candidatus Verstraetearchaeota archaeon]|nr:ABC transporter ATP-binding protein [Candidatus Verstraetearchaeota archaeon]